MSNYIIPCGAREGGKGSVSARKPAAMLGAVAGVGLLLILPGQARADRGGYSSGHAEITLGFPNGQVTVGKTWESDPGQVVVEKVVHDYPEADYDEDVAGVDMDAEESEHIIIEKRRPRARKVTIIERYEEPVHCDRVEVVRKIYVQPRVHHRHDVVVYSPSPRVIHAPSRTVVVASGGHGRSHHGGHYGNRHGGYHVKHHGGGHGRYVKDRGHGPKNLFRGGHDRPSRERGTRKHMVQVGSRR